MHLSHKDNVNILIVDDEPSGLRVLESILTKRGYDVRPAINGQLALFTAREKTPDLVLLDICLPDMDGYEVCRQLKADERTCSVPVIFISGRNEIADKVKGFKVGGVDYITKPIQVEEVLARVETHLAVQALQKRLKESNRQLQREIDEHKRTQEMLKKTLDGLEVKVAERTAELSERTVQLEAQALELARAKEAAEAANRAKSTFLAHMSHQLRTPLNAIMGFAQILQMHGHLPARQREQVDTIYTSGKHLLRLINDILDLSRIEAQQEKTESKAFSLSDLLHAVLSATRTNAAKKNLSVRYEESSALPEIVKGDEHKLHQVLLNLLDNAVTYTEQGSVTLRVSKLETRNLKLETPSSETEIPVSIRFEVSDTGIGIPKEDLDAVFDPFTIREVKGVVAERIGLGLTISRRLVDLMGGRLSVASDPGKGSTFTVDLDLEVVEGAGGEARAPEKTATAYKGERKRLLIVDDKITNLSMLVSVLEPLGFAIETAASGQEAIDKAAAIHPDLILMDLLMPDMDGDETLRNIRGHEGLGQVKIIGVSAAVADRDRTAKFSAVCDDFISKPVHIDTLLKKLGEQLQIEWIEKEEIP